MARRPTGSGSTLEQQTGYTRALVDVDRVFVSGTIGFDYRTMTISDDLPQQTDQCSWDIQTSSA